jgi:hypothetical protein
VAQLSETIPQRLAVDVLGPEEVSEPFALDGRAPAQSEEGQKSRALTRAQTWERAVAQPDFEGSEEVEAERGERGIGA